MVQYWHFMLDVALVILFSRFISYFFYRVKQPRIIGDILAGCLLGPTLIGPHICGELFPAELKPFVKVFGQLGIMLSSMTAGSNFDRRLLHGQYLRVFGYGFANVVVGALFALPVIYLMPESFQGSEYKASSCFLLLAALLGCCALPMTFLILDELKVSDTAIAKFCIGFCCVVTVLVFTMVSIASFMSSSDAKYMLAVRTILMIVFLVGLLVIQWLWTKSIDYFGTQTWAGKTTTDLCLIEVSLCLTGGVASERLGYTFLLGSFLVGAALPFNDAVRGIFSKHFKFIGRWFLLPFFFLDTGLSLNLRKVKAEDIGGIIMVVACCFLCKLVLVPVGMIFMGKRDSSFAASIANTRGFICLVIASAGVSLNQFGPSLYISVIFCSLLTSAAAGPLCKIFAPPLPIVQRPSTLKLYGGVFSADKTTALLSQDHQQQQQQQQQQQPTQLQLLPVPTPGTSTHPSPLSSPPKAETTPSLMSPSEGSIMKPEMSDKKSVRITDVEMSSFLLSPPASAGDKSRPLTDSAANDKSSSQLISASSARSMEEGATSQEGVPQRKPSKSKRSRGLSALKRISTCEQGLAKLLEQQLSGLGYSQPPLTLRPFFNDDDPQADQPTIVFLSDKVLAECKGQVPQTTAVVDDQQRSGLFLASTLVDWLIANGVCPDSRELAVAVCNRLIQLGFIAPVGPQQEFIDGSRVYMFA